MAKVMVTGGCGYIGSHSIVDLLEAGHEVFSVDNYLNSAPEVLGSIRDITSQNVFNVPVDLCDRHLLEEIFISEHPDVIIHFAALKSVPESVAKPLLYYQNNLIGLMNLLDLQQKYKVRDFIFSSSCSVYGNPDTLPVTETTPLAPAESPYAHTKQVSEEIIRNFSNVHTNLRFVFLRYFNPAGAHDSILMGESPASEALNLVPIITETGIGKRPKLTVFGDDYDTRDGTCIRDFIHIMDLARAHTLSLERLLDHKSEELIEVFNLGTGNGISVKEAISSFEKVSQVSLNYEIGPRRPGDVISIYSDYSHAEQILGWRPERNIDDIMETAWKWEKVRSSASA